MEQDELPDNQAGFLVGGLCLPLPPDILCETLRSGGRR